MSESDGVGNGVVSATSCDRQSTNGDRQVEAQPIEVQNLSKLNQRRKTLPAVLLRSYVTEADGIVTINGTQQVVARMGSRVNALGGTVIAGEQSDIRACIGAHVEFLPGSRGIIEFGTDAKLWSGATVKVVDDINTFLHHDLTVNL